jgi:hypothetical protein
MIDLSNFEMSTRSYRNTVKSFVNKAIKLINMLDNHSTAQADFQAAGVEDVASLWGTLNNMKANISEKTFDMLGDSIFDSLECPEPVDIGADKGSWLSRTFKRKKKEPKKVFSIN